MRRSSSQNGKEKCLLVACLLVATPPPPIRRPNLAEFAEMVCRIVRFLNFADLFCRITRFLGLCRLVLPTCWGLWVLGHLNWRHPLLWDTAQYLFFVHWLFRLAPCSVFTVHKRMCLWFPGIRCPPLIKLCFGTSILMPVRGQFANFVFALHGPVRSSAAVLRAAHQQAPNQWIPGYWCLLWIL